MIPGLEVDETWYLKKYPEVVQQILSGTYADAQDHYLRAGHFTDFDPNPAFSTTLYKNSSGWWTRRHASNPLLDYITYSGEFKGSVTWLFDEAAFQAADDAVRDAVEKKNLISAFVFYCRNEELLPQVRPNPIFNASYYRRQAQVPAGQSATLHYLQKGQVEDIAPSALFDPEFFRLRYPDSVSAAARYNSLAHYFMAEGIRHGQQSIPDFDQDYYLKAYPEVKDAINSGVAFTAFDHFLRYGLKEGRRPNPFFDPIYYLENNPSAVKDMLAGSYLGAFEHFLEIGMKKGFKAHPSLRARTVDDIDAKALFEKRAAVVANLLTATNSVQFEEVAVPKVSLVIPVYNHFNFTMQLLGRLSETFSGHHHSGEVIVVDNGSTDRTTELESLAPGVRYVRLSKPVGYTLACNAGAEIAKGEIVIFLNNDIELAPGTVWRAVEVLADTDVGAVGGRIVQLNGAIQEAGGIVWNDASTVGFGRGEDPDQGKFLVQRDVDYVSGCFLALRRELFKQLGGFAADFAPGYYEEVDLCARIWQHGLRVVFDPAVLLFHYEYASYSVGRPPSASTARIAAKREIFQKRNIEFVRKRPGNRGSDLNKIAFVRSPSRPKHVVVIEDQEPHPLKGSGFNRSGDIIRGMRENGWSVTVLARYGDVTQDPAWNPNGFIQYVSERNLENGIAGYLCSNASLIDAVWVCRTHNFASLAPAIQAWKELRPDAIAIADTEAVASTRIIELRRVAGMSQDGSNLDTMVREEIGSATFADVLVAVNDIDRQVLSGKLCPVATLGQSFPSMPTPAPFAQRTGFLFVGAVNSISEPNYDSLTWYVNSVWPQVRKSLPEATLTIIANWSASVEVPPFMSENGVRLHPGVKDLEPYFDKARVFVAPTRFAGGIPHKVQNALSYGLPAVCSSLLARQLGLMDQGEPLLHSDVSDADKFAENCVLLHESKPLWTASRKAAINYIVNNCSWSKYCENIYGILNWRHDDEL